MAAQKNLFELLVLKIVDGQQTQIDKLSTEIHGGQLPGVKQLTLENRANLEALSKTVGEQSDELEKHGIKLEALAITDNEVDHIQASRSKWTTAALQVLASVIMLVLGIIAQRVFHIAA